MEEKKETNRRRTEVYVGESVWVDKGDVGNDKIEVKMEGEDDGENGGSECRGR